MKKIPVWIDTDTGVDDAAALLVACRLPEIEIVGVSAVNGNTNLANTYRNSRDVLALAGRADIPVYKGAAEPLVVLAESADDFHGRNGLGDVTLPPSPAPHQTTEAGEALRQALQKYGRELRLVAVGPLTNIARLLLKHPDVAENIGELLIMGGAVNGGNVTPSAEFNIYADPEAAEIVFKSGIQIKMFGLDATTEAYFTPEEFATMTEKANPITSFLQGATGRAWKYYNEGYAKGLILHDICPVIYLADPEMFTLQQAGVRVECCGRLTLGKTVCDLYSDFKFSKRNCLVATSVRRERFVAKVREVIALY